MQSVAMRIIYKGVFHWFLKLIVGVQFTDCQFLKKEKQFIILANHNSFSGRNQRKVGTNGKNKIRYSPYPVSAT